MVDLPDARSLSAESLEHIRLVAVRAVLDLKMTRKEAAAILGVGEHAIGQWCAAYQQGGVEALAVQPLGRPEGVGRSLTIAQEKIIRCCLLDSMPGDHHIPLATWTRRAVAELIRRRFDIELTLPAVGKYLSRWGMTPQKPARHAREQDEDEVREFVEETLPNTVEKAKEEGGELHFADEVGAEVADQIGTSYAPRGQTPVLEFPKTRIQQNVISSVSPDGELEYWLFSGTMNQTKFIQFLEQLVASSPRKIFLFADRHPTHTARGVEDWLAERADQIEMVWLPRYSPEYNPDEFLNNDLKQNLENEPLPADTPEFRETIRGILEKIAGIPARIPGYFQQAQINLAGD